MEELVKTLTDKLSVGGVSAKIPPFNRDDVRWWFVQLEAQFDISRVLVERTQFHYVIANLPPEQANMVRDIVGDGFQAGKYQRLKNAIIDRFKVSATQRMRNVLDQANPNPGETPSAFYRRLRTQAGPEFPYDVFLNRYLNGLPKVVTAAVALTSQNLFDAYEADKKIPEALEKQLLDVADNVASLQSVSVSAVTSKTSNQKRNNNNRHGEKRGKDSVHTSSTARYLCANHTKYRAKTRSCADPRKCSWVDRPKVAAAISSEEGQMRPKNE